MKIRQSVFAVATASAMAGASNSAQTQSLDSLIAVFDIVGIVSNENLNPQTTVGDGSVALYTIFDRSYNFISVDGTSVDELLRSQTATPDTVQFQVNGDLITITTTADVLSAPNAEDQTTISGVVQGVNSSITFAGDGEDVLTENDVEVRYNGEALRIIMPEGQSLSAITLDMPITLTVDGETVFSGTTEEFEGRLTDGDIVIASALNILNPITTGGVEVQQLHTGSALSRADERIHRVFSAAGHQRSPLAPMAGQPSRPGPNQQLVFAGGSGISDYGGLITSTVAQVDTLTGQPVEAEIGLWADFDYTDFGSDDLTVRSDGTMVSGAVGVDFLLAGTRLYGVSVAYDRLEIETGPTGANRLEANVFNVSPYVAASLFSDTLIPHAQFNLALMDIETRSSLGATGDTDGLSASGRIGATVQTGFGNDLVVLGAFTGIELGYQKLNGFEDSVGVQTDTNETWAGSVDAGVRASLRLLNRLAATGSVSYVYDYSRHLSDDFFVGQLSDDYVEIDGEIVWQPMNEFALDFGASTKLGQNDRREYTIGGGAQFTF